MPAFVDVLLAEWAEDDERARVLAGLDELGVDFLALGEADQVSVLEELDAEGVRARQSDVDPLPFFATL
ncbi:MAG: hypothetical protein GWN07_04180, partial [Actinobacteria bacterium]|nr:gluconate 2-dehydrogenase subunit 3 family protein [Actinomycetota bacterium]NIV54566.1 hypothetical protein [Actinomycetota bacterium]NIV85886.1 hypothetical protein [Actinomycetota bacterium]NIW26507.1 hypothetical protein [Actinomycetota bacterium]NIX19075.1 hypothetical protein [Actinomycetota bacterium]